ncbi:murein hydrolase activator EnvC family protein [Microbacterium flavescens]|jgi:murein DD-endopeptidase MepM/ murein hydrolase activator NlpD|uniref:murein hydrolase activator EnvC family protein n=1 Tax=Microbacterium flavescens TaxID=69366 RepID=UPI001BDE0175|nr:M23 family metallopeptidase [Microbacterium flavescens]BFF11667.1 hypothetical protein GCM10025699_29700 [Microbacterium flavescens]
MRAPSAPPCAPRRTVALLIIVLAVLAGAAPAAAGAGETQASGGAELDGRSWSWPLTAFRLDRPFQAPAHAYGAGHRGIDLRPLDAGAVRAPAPGTVAFSGPVAGRGILTIDHGDGLVTTLEPVDTSLRAGAMLRAGDPVGTIGLGGHTEPGALHFGVRLHGEYVNPLLLLGGVPRAVLLPCC